MSYGSSNREQGTPEVAEKYPDVYSYILNEESAFRTTGVPLSDNWRDWNFYEHVDRSFTLKNSRFYQGNQDYTRPFDNIIIPIANVNYRAEGFRVKNVNMFVDDPEKYYKSFFAKKYHTWWAVENKINTAIKGSVVSYFDYGLMLLKNVNEARPEVVDLKDDIAFVDQTDVMSGPICLKHNYSIPELLDMKGKWYKDEIDQTILFSQFSKSQGAGQDVDTPGKYIKVYELHGTFPESWLGPEKLGSDWEDEGKYTPQIHIITYYTSPSDGTKKGICLFKGKEPKPIFKALKRDSINGRACGRGGIEELFHAQIWTNYSQLQIVQMLEATAKVILKASKKVAKHNNLKNMKHGQIIEVEGDEKFEQMVLQPINKVAFDNNIDRWAMVAQKIGSATDASLSQTPASGVPLGTLEILTAEGQGTHEDRKGEITDFWVEVYRDWVLPHFANEITKGSKWLDTLSLEELQEVAEKVSISGSNERIKKMVLSGKMVSKEEADTFRQVMKEDFIKGGEKRFIEILKDEFKDLPMDVEIDIAGKQADLADRVTKLNAIFRSVFTPAGIQVLQTEPAAGKILNQILEASGLSPVNFSGIVSPLQPKQLPAPATPGLAINQ